LGIGRTWAGALAALALVACSKRPPADFAPAPGLLARIRGIEVSTPAARACPGQVIPMTYVAVLNDGGRIPFARTYDKDRPPALHVVFLEKWSDQARPQEDGDWTAAGDPLTSLATGFELNVSMKHRPGIRAQHTIPPAYECLAHAFRFVGATGEDGGGTGGDGPDIVVRLGFLRTPFYDRLLVAGIEVGRAAPFYTLAEARAVPPRDWLVIEARGGRGGRGTEGEPGAKGRSGQSGCPGGRGGRGGDGGNGGTGGQGGRGGRDTIVAPQEAPSLAGFVEVRAPGGEAGAGGAAGAAGDGGAGGAATAGDATCRPGQAGPAGNAGEAGPDGIEGRRGPRAQVITVPARDVFGNHAPPQLTDLLQ
jgi:hypothetical protein